MTVKSFLNRVKTYSLFFAQKSQPTFAHKLATGTTHTHGAQSSFFIILGCPRSGTTLLAQCLSAHSSIFVPYESDIFVPCMFLMNQVSDPALGKRLISDLITNSRYFNWSLGKYLSAKEVRRSVRQSEYSMNSIFSNLYGLVGEKLGKQIVGDKSPNDIFEVAPLAGSGLLDQPTKIIHIVRDLRDVITSINRQNWVTDADVWFPRFWGDRNLYLHERMNNKPNYLMLRYEDFVAAPAEWLSTVCNFLDAEFEARMLDTGSFSEFYKTIPAHSHLHDPIDTHRIGEWRKSATREQLERYENLGREALIKFGYL